MRSTLLLAVSLALSLALGALCTESKDHERVRYPSGWACLGRVLGNIMGATALLVPKAVGEAVVVEGRLVGEELPGFSQGAGFPCLSVQLMCSLSWVCL